MNEYEKKQPRMRYCFYCGKELGRYKNYDQHDTCGKPECDIAARDAWADRRNEAHEQLDRDIDYRW